MKFTKNEFALKSKIISCFYTLLLTVFFSITIDAQTFFTNASWPDSSLTLSQRQRLTKVINQSSFTPYNKVNFGDITTITNNEIDISISGAYCGTSTFVGKSIEFTSTADYTWYGTLKPSSDTTACSTGYLLLIVKDGESYGQIHLSDQHYSIEDLGGKHIIKEILTDTTRSVVCGGVSPVSSINNEEIIETRDNNCEVTVLVLYTPKANLVANNINNVINTVVAGTNQAFRNSSISSQNARITLKAAELIQYDETGQVFQDILDDISSNTTTGPTRRDFHRADIVVLFVDEQATSEKTFSGLAQWGIFGGAAYAVVKTTRASSDFTFAHEVGHLFGLSHEKCVSEDATIHCNDIGVYNHAHTWSFKKGKWPFRCTVKRETIMFSASADNPNVIQHFSNPAIKFENKSTGVSNDRHNSRAINENACSVANFDARDNFLSVRIDGPSSMCLKFDAQSLCASISGTTGPFTYEWKKSTSGTDWNTQPSSGTSNCYTATPFSGSEEGDVLYIRLKVTSSIGIKYAYHSIYLYKYGYDGYECLKPIGPNVKDLNFQQEDISLKVNPNPVKDNLSITWNKDSNKTEINIYNNAGLKIFNKFRDYPSNGLVNESIDLSGLPSGIYYLELSLDNKLYTKSFTIID